MKKILMMVIAMAAMATVNTACEVDAEIHPHLLIDNIVVEPADWDEYWIDDRFDHWYVNLPMVELGEEVLESGFFHTYWEYTEVGENGKPITVWESEGSTKTYERFEDGVWVRYMETISCSYAIGELRISISRSDGNRRRPSETLHFRTIIFR